MSSQDRMLAAHLARRAGFGATPEELDRYVGMRYEALVEEFLLSTESRHLTDQLYRVFPEHHASPGIDAPAVWAYRMITTSCPLEEKITLFWHGVFATANSKLNNSLCLLNQIDMFRRCGLGRFDDLLIELSKDPAMIIWLDNQTNQDGSINENYGREILELFSMGVGNYTEGDVKECARAFTGWTVANAEYMALMAEKASTWPYGRIAWHFQYRDDDHDDGEKAFLGEKGRFNGEDVVEIICRQPATACFLSRHLYNFFVADEAPVPQWSHTPPRDLDALEVLSEAYMEAGHDIRSVLRVLFNSDFFKESQFARVKSPVELVIGTLHSTGEYRDPGLGITTAIDEAGFMGQFLLHPPSVEGWHTGEEWIDSGALVDRVNYAAQHMGDLSNPGVKDMVHRIVGAHGDTLAPSKLVDACLSVLGPLPVSDDTRSSLIEVASQDGEIDLSRYPEDQKISQTMQGLLRMIASCREYQLA